MILFWIERSYYFRVTSCELLVTSWKFKSTSWKSVQIHELQAEIHELRVQIHALPVQIYGFKSTSSRIIKSMKTRVNSLKVFPFPKVLSLKVLNSF